MPTMDNPDFHRSDIDIRREQYKEIRAAQAKARAASASGSRAAPINVDDAESRATSTSVDEEEEEEEDQEDILCVVLACYRCIYADRLATQRRY